MYLLLPMAIMFIGFFIKLIGIALAPIAALICAYIARRRGLNPMRCAAIAAAYTALSVFLWIYLIRRLLGAKPARDEIFAAYICVYSSVVICTAASASILIAAYDHFTAGRLLTWTVSLAIAMLLWAALTVNLFLLNKRSPQNPTPPAEPAPIEKLPSPLHILPFALASANILALSTLTLAYPTFIL